MNDRDPRFAEKAVAIIELLLTPPTDGPLFCVDDKPGIGVRQPTAPDQPPAPGRPARREFEYVRRGTVDLLAGFRVGDGRVCGLVRRQHRWSSLTWSDRRSGHSVAVGLSPMRGFGNASRTQEGPLSAPLVETR